MHDESTGEKGLKRHLIKRGKSTKGLSLFGYELRRLSLGGLAGLIIVSSFITTGIGSLLPTAPIASATKQQCEESGGEWKTDQTDAWATGGYCKGKLAIVGMTPGDQAKSHSYYVTLSTCVNDQIKESIKVTGENYSNVPPRDWFGDHNTYGYVYPDAKKTDCWDIMKSAAKLWGMSTNTLLEGIGCTFKADKSEYSCPSDKSKRKANWGTFYKTRVSDKDPAALSDEGKYVLYLNAFQGTCSAKQLAKKGDNPIYDDKVKNNKIDSASEVSPDGLNVFTDRAYANVTIVNKDNKTEDFVYSYVKSYGSGYSTLEESAALYGYHNDVRKIKCSDLAKDLSGLAKKYATWATTNQELAEVDNPSGANCATEPDAEDCKEEEDKSSCGIEGIGWLVCPVMKFTSDLSDNLFGFLADSFLKTDAKLIDMNGGAGQAWSIFRNLANVIFVVIFLIAIFSQMSSMGISNYGLKKMLPKMMIAAILINASFLICQIAVDLSNILGYSLKDLIGSIGESAMKSGGVDATGNGFGIAAIVVVLIAGGVTVALAASFPVLLAVVLALLMIVIILMARTAIIVLLVVISPLAFAAYILPSTSDWFTKWRKLFMGLLLLFPIIALAFGGGQLAGGIMYSVANGEVTLQLMALGMTVLPLFAVPSLLKGSLKGIGALGNKLGGISDSANRRIGGKVKGNSTLGQVGRRFQSNASMRNIKALSGEDPRAGGAKNPLNWGARTRRKAFDSRLTGSFGSDQAAQGAELRADQEAKDIKAQAALLNNEFMGDLGDAGAGTGLAGELRRATLGGNNARAKAITNIMASKGGSGIDAMAAAMEGVDAGKASEVRQHISAEHGQIVKSKNAALMTWSTTGQGSSTKLSTEPGSPGLSESSAADLSTQTARALEANKSSINPETAKQLLDTAQLSGGIDKKQEKILREVAAGAAPTSAPTVVGGGSPQSQQSPQGQQPAQGPVRLRGGEETQPNGLIIPRDRN